MPTPLDYAAPRVRQRSHGERVAIATAATAVIGGVSAALLLIVLHPHALSAVPAAPVMLLCLLGGGGDWGAILFIWTGGFVLYGLYGLAVMLPTRKRIRVLAAVACVTVHTLSAVGCELIRRGLL